MSNEFSSSTANKQPWFTRHKHLPVIALHFYSLQSSKVLPEKLSYYFFLPIHIQPEKKTTKQNNTKQSPIKANNKPTQTFLKSKSNVGPLPSFTLKLTAWVCKHTKWQFKTIRKPTNQKARDMLQRLCLPSVFYFFCVSADVYNYKLQ